jgi:glycosyltransferase involved in cell wall biosynthesis
MLKPGVSVVICCYNSAGVIIPAINSLSAQYVPPGAGYEVILVDNNCTDDTVRLAEDSWKHPTAPLRIVKESQPGLIYARMAGVLQVRYQILLFVDDDNILKPDWVERLVELYAKRPEVGGIGGYIEPLFEGEGEGERPAWFEKFSGMYACTPPHENPGVSAFKQTLYGAGLSLRAQAAHSVFDPALPFFLVGRTQDTLNRGDDSEICLRAGLMGWKLWYERTLKMKHYILKRRITWDYVLQARRGGGHADIILKIYRDMLEGNTPLKHSQLSIYISSLWREFWQNRVKHTDLVKLKNEGDNVALMYHYLLGLTEGFLKMDKHDYDKTREHIVKFFPKK